MVDLAIAGALAAGFSILICIIEVKRGSAATYKSCIKGSTVLYLIILMAGNIATTSVAAQTTAKFFRDTATNARSSPVKTSAVAGENSQSAIENSSTTETKPTHTNGNVSNSNTPGRPQAAQSLVLRIPWFWYAFLGVFAFEALLQNINLTLFSRGVLSINDWISKARENAVADAIEAQTNADVQRTQSLAGKLRTVATPELNAHVLHNLGALRLHELEATARSAGADDRLVKALALAQEAPDVAAAINI